MFFGFCLGGWIADEWGKKLTMFVFNLLAYACWITTACGNNMYLIFFTHTLQGFFGAIAFNCIGKWMKFIFNVNSILSIEIISMHIFKEYILLRSQRLH